MTGPAMAIDVGMADALLTTTRAVRRRLDLSRAVEPGLIAAALQVAVQAPNARNEQAWRWIVVSDPAVRSELAAIAQRGLPSGNATRPSGPIVRSARHLVENLARVPVLIFACMSNRLPDAASARQRSDFYASILPAVWNLQLALRARGIGSALSTSLLAEEQDLMRVLGVPDAAEVVAMLAAGHLGREDLRPAQRRPIRDVAFTDRWGAPFPADR